MVLLSRFTNQRQLEQIQFYTRNNDTQLDTDTTSMTERQKEKEQSIDLCTQQQGPFGRNAALTDTDWGAELNSAVSTFYIRREFQVSSQQKNIFKGKQNGTKPHLLQSLFRIQNNAHFWSNLSRFVKRNASLSVCNQHSYCSGLF